MVNLMIDFKQGKCKCNGRLLRRSTKKSITRECFIDSPGNYRMCEEGRFAEVFTLPHQFLVESSGFLRIPRNPRNEPEFENLRIFIKFPCVIPGSFLVHSWFIPIPFLVCCINIRNGQEYSLGIHQDRPGHSRSFLTIIILVRKIKCTSKN
jgi:hypothetical protein